MQSQIISVGTELTTGVTVDTNAAWLSRALAGAGWQSRRHVTVADDRAQIAAEILEASHQAEVVVVTGGLGPTEDDVTREGLADAMGAELVCNDGALGSLKEFFRQRQMNWVEANRRQACHPAGATLLTNEWGTAPGLRAELNRARVFCLPGVPREMRMMFEAGVLPELRAQGVGRRLFARTLHCFGTGEAKIGDAVADLMQPGRPVTVGITACEGIITLRFFAWCESQSEADRVIGQDIEEVRSRLGRLIFGEGEMMLAEAVGQLLIQMSATVSTAESCTGGMVAKLITDVPGSSQYFVGGVVPYANAAKTELVGIGPDLLAQHGAVSEPVALALADQCRLRSGSDYAISTTGIAGPGGATADKPVGLVYIGLASRRTRTARKLLYGSHLSRDDIRTRASLAVLNLLRLNLLDDAPANGDTPT